MGACSVQDFQKKEVIYISQFFAPTVSLQPCEEIR